MVVIAACRMAVMLLLLAAASVGSIIDTNVNVGCESQLQLRWWVQVDGGVWAAAVMEEPGSIAAPVELVTIIDGTRSETSPSPPPISNSSSAVLTTTTATAPRRHGIRDLGERKDSCREPPARCVPSTSGPLVMALQLSSGSILTMVCTRSGRRVDRRPAQNSRVGTRTPSRFACPR